MAEVDLAISSGLDQPITARFDGAAKQIDARLKEASERKDLGIVLNVLQSAVAMQQVGGLATSRIVYRLKTTWAEYGSDYDFEDFAYMNVGLARDTVRRYSMVGELFAERLAGVDSETFRLMHYRPIRELVAVAQFVQKHGELSPQQYAEIARAGTTSEVRELLARYAGRKPTEDRRLVFFIDREGTLYARKGGKRVPIGFLRTEPEDMADPVRKEAVERLLATLGVVEL